MKNVCSYSLINCTLMFNKCLNREMPEKKFSNMRKSEMKQVIPGGSIVSKNVIPKDLTDEAFRRFSNVIPGGNPQQNGPDSVSYLLGVSPVVMEPEYKRTAQSRITGTKFGQELDYSLGTSQKPEQLKD